jgi:hypothetical protein
MRAQRQATRQRRSLAAFQLTHWRYAGLIRHAAQMVRCVGYILEFTNLLRTFRISSLRPASGYLTPIGVDATREATLSQGVSCQQATDFSKKKGHTPSQANVVA